MNAQEILTTITLGLCGWNLLETIRQGKLLAALKQQIHDLPCVSKKNCVV